MTEMIKERRSGRPGINRDDLFSNLLRAAEEDNVEFSEEDLLGMYVCISNLSSTTIRRSGNIFVFLVAGQETNSHGLAFALAFLALYPEEQEKMYAQIAHVRADKDAHW